MTFKAKKLILSGGILVGVLAACLGFETKQSNHLGWALLFAATAFTSIGCISLGILSPRSGGKQQNSDQSLWLPSLGVLVISLVTPVEYLFLSPMLPRGDNTQDVGLILFAGGMVFYLLALRSPEAQMASIKRSNSKDPSPPTVWRLFLYPIPASLMLTMIGLGIGYSSLVGLLLLFLLVLLLFISGFFSIRGYP